MLFGSFTTTGPDDLGLITYGHKQEYVLTNGDPVHRSSLTPQWAEILGYTGTQHYLDSYSSPQWSVHSLWAQEYHNGQLRKSEEEKSQGQPF